MLTTWGWSLIAMHVFSTKQNPNHGFVERAGGLTFVIEESVDSVEDERCECKRAEGSEGSLDVSFHEFLFSD